MKSTTDPKDLNKRIAELRGSIMIRRYSQSIDASWELFEDLKDCSIRKGFVGFDDKTQSLINGYLIETEYPSGMGSSTEEYARAKTAPEAICKAWIKWKEKKLEFEANKP